MARFKEGLPNSVLIMRDTKPDTASSPKPPEPSPLTTTTHDTQDTKIMADRPIIGAGGEYRPFEKQQELDRKYLRKHISSMIGADSKWDARPHEQRRAAVLARRDYVLATRAKTNSGTTRSHYPSKHDEEEEERWIVEEFGFDIEGGKSRAGKSGGKGEDGRMGDKDQSQKVDQGERERVLREETGKEYAESDDEDDEEGCDGCADGDDDEPIGWARSDRVAMETVKQGEVEGEEIRVASRESESSGKGVPVGKELCTIFALSIRLSPGVATKPYWGFNDQMEMVLITPSGVAAEVGVFGGPGVKRKGDCAERDGSLKRVKFL